MKHAMLSSKTIDFEGSKFFGWTENQHSKALNGAASRACTEVVAELLKIRCEADGRSDLVFS